MEDWQRPVVEAFINNPDRLPCDNPQGAHYDWTRMNDGPQLRRRHPNNRKNPSHD